MIDTTPIILAVIGTGVTLLGILAGLLVSLFRILRQDIKETNSRIDALRQEMRTDIAALHSRIDNLYQALFSHKDPAA
ncbi:MAG: hypothetical protein OXI92_03910 [Acidobacteriota bacterium]|nr:hypothetical protein [Acidobacteriota bacterium]